MTSSQKCWQRPKVPQGHWLLTDSSLLCKFYVSFFQMWDLQFSLTWNKLLYHNPLCLLPPFLALTLRSWHQDSSTLSAWNGLWTLSMSNFIYMHDMMQWPNFFSVFLFNILTKNKKLNAFLTVMHVLVIIFYFPIYMRWWWLLLSSFSTCSKIFQQAKALPGFFVTKDLCSRGQ